jgi:hypothetical protein
VFVGALAGKEKGDAASGKRSHHASRNPRPFRGGGGSRDGSLKRGGLHLRVDYDVVRRLPKFDICPFLFAFGEKKIPFFLSITFRYFPRKN